MQIRNYRTSIIILIAIFASIIFSTFPIAQAQTSPTTLTVGTYQGHPGDTFTLPIQIDTSIPIIGYQFDLRYDPTYVQVFDGSGSSVKDNGWMVIAAGNEASLWGNSPIIDNTNGRIVNAAWALIGNIGTGANGSGTLATVKFTVPQGAPNGTSTITLENVIVADVDGHQLPEVALVSGWVQVGTGGFQAIIPTPSTVISTATPGKSLAYSLTLGNIKKLSIDGVVPNDTNMANGTYPLTYVLHIYYPQ